MPAYDWEKLRSSSKRGGARRSGAYDWDALGGGGRSGKSVDDRLSAVEDAAAQAGYEPPGMLKSAAMRALDVLSRGNYAAAGAAEELFTERGGGPLAALKRAGREVFSGIGGLKGDKEGFAQVMEQSGVGTGGSLSDLAPFLYNDTGEGLRFKRGGWADPTGRGAGGLAMDIVLDPINLISLGSAKGLTVAGKTVPLTDKVTMGVARNVVRARKAIPLAEETYNALGKIFNRDWMIRLLPGAERRFQAHINRQVAAEAKLSDEIGRSAIAAIPKSKRAQWFDDVQAGVAREKYKNDPVLLKAIDDAEALNKNFADAEVAEGLLDPDRLRENYLASFYDNKPEELRRIARQLKAEGIWPATKEIDKATLGRHAEMRAFDTVKEAEEWSKRLHDADVAAGSKNPFPILKPVRDPMKVMMRRGQASIRAISTRQYYRDIAKAYPLLSQIPHGADIAEDMARPQTGAQEVARRELLDIKEPADAIRVLEKNGVENAPKASSLEGRIAEDGTNYVKVDLPGTKGAEIPESLLDHLREMPDKVLKSEELNHMLRYFDRANNVFKSFVTLPFPAFHFRNAHSNIAQGFADVGMSILNPGRHFDGIAAMRGAEGGFTSKVGEEISYKAEQEAMRQNGVLQSGRALLEYTGEKGIDRLSTVKGKITSAPRRAGQAIENEARAALYMVYRRKGLSQIDAAERVNKFLFDYTNLSRVEQEFFRRMIPFYTYARKNVERQFRNILDKPGLTAAEVKAFRGRVDENEQMTSWEGNSFKLRLNRDGKTLTTLSGIDLPFRQLDLLWKGSVPETLRGQIGMLSPILQAPLVGAFGKVPFTNREIERSPNSPIVGRVIEHMPKGLQQYLGYKKEMDAAGRPKYTFEGDKFYAIFQSWALSRLVSTSDRQFKTMVDEGWGPMLLDGATGLRYNEINLDEEQAKKRAERLRYLEKWGREKGILREYERTYAPKGN